MCRNIKRLFNFDPVATPEEVRASALQYVRKLSGMRVPARANVGVFERAVQEVTEASQRLLEGLTTQAAPRSREEEARKARARGEAREARLRERLRSDGGAA